MDNSRRAPSKNFYLAVAVSSLLAFVLTVIQLPQWLFYFWPDWIAMVVVYWAMTSPDRFGPFIGFCMGLLLEVLFVRNFGVQGLGLAVLAFTVNSAHQQLKVLSVWQQTLLVAMFIGVYKLITGWLYGLIVDFTITAEYSYSLLGCILVWPFVKILMDELRRIARIR